MVIALKPSGDVAILFCVRPGKRHIFRFPAIRLVKLVSLLISFLLVLLLNAYIWHNGYVGLHQIKRVVTQRTKMPQTTVLQAVDIGLPTLNYDSKTAPFYTILRVTHENCKNICPVTVQNPIGRIRISRDPPTWEQLEVKYAGINTVTPPKVSNATDITGYGNENLVAITVNSSPTGAIQGLWRPVHCRPSQTLALILPYRKREQHLRAFLNHMHAFLRHQQVTYTIFVIEQLGWTQFNRAALFNIGFRESKRVRNFDCFIFHDVDLIPEDDRLPYRCGHQPIHLSASVDKHGYRLLYPNLFGGAVALSRFQFEKVRGFSNMFFGWGGEDDDLYYRVTKHHYHVFRHPMHIARFTMLAHKREELNKVNPKRHKLLKISDKRLNTDGYPESEYTVTEAGLRHGGLVYWVSVEIREGKVMEGFKLS
ncbi:unnamed protein product [Calicophoron daubneyi]|uniref:Beta-1,4-galactosyltransferase n=1 Tax=Calicophoron daubneyi TaxID=300641 RepID=A0AAV2TCV3_CALDB